MKDKIINSILIPQLTKSSTWFNTQSLTIASLKGKVVLIDFWTYSCVNCLRTLPYLKEWHRKYHAQGLVIIGVHAPEFEFEHNPENVARAIHDFGIEYPVVLDNDFAVWRAFDNHYWPAKYLIDREGKLRYHHFGEGDYAETEMVIQNLIGESASSAALVDIPEFRHETRSPETYLGYWRLSRVVSEPEVIPDTAVNYTSPSSFPTNGLAFVGTWTVRHQFAASTPGSRLRFRFDAKEVNLVMKPHETYQPQPVEVYLDGKNYSSLTIDSDKLYNLISLPQAGNHYLELVFPAGNVEVYAITFG